MEVIKYCSCIGNYRCFECKSIFDEEIKKAEEEHKINCYEIAKNAENDFKKKYQLPKDKIIENIFSKINDCKELSCVSVCNQIHKKKFDFFNNHFKNTIDIFAYDKALSKDLFEKCCPDECSICLEKKDKTNFLLLQCGHFICRKCVFNICNQKKFEKKYFLSKKHTDYINHTVIHSKRTPYKYNEIFHLLKPTSIQQKWHCEAECDCKGCLKLLNLDVNTEDHGIRLYDFIGDILDYSFTFNISVKNLTETYTKFNSTFIPEMCIKCPNCKNDIKVSLNKKAGLLIIKATEYIDEYPYYPCGYRINEKIYIELKDLIINEEEIYVGDVDDSDNESDE